MIKNDVFFAVVDILDSYQKKDKYIIENQIINVY